MASLFPVITNDSNRVVVAAYETQAEATARASSDTALIDGGRGAVAGVEVGMHLPASGAPTLVLPETDEAARLRLLGDACDWADDVVDMVLPSWYLRAGASNAEATARYEQCRCWAICAVAAIRGAAMASWTPAQIEGLLAAQRALMPRDPALIRRWYAEHVTGSAPGWTAACAPVSGTGSSARVRAHFNAGPTTTAATAPAFGSDYSGPPAWDGSSGRPNVTLYRNSAPDDYRTL